MIAMFQNIGPQGNSISWNGKQEGAEYGSWNIKRFQGVTGFVTGQNIIQEFGNNFP
jgi:hypothetical protein